MHIFQVNEKIKSYLLPILKILLSSGVIVLLVNRGRWIHITGQAWKVVDAILGFVIGALAIFCVCISLVEMLDLYERKEKQRMDAETAKKHAKGYTLDEIEVLLAANDVMEMMLISKNRIFSIGSASDNRNGSAKFFDKVFYIDDTEYVEIAELRVHLQQLSENNMLLVAAIDDIPADRIKKE